MNRTTRFLLLCSLVHLPLVLSSHVHDWDRGVMEGFHKRHLRKSHHIFDAFFEHGPFFRFTCSEDDAVDGEDCRKERETSLLSWIVLFSVFVVVVVGGCYACGFPAPTDQQQQQQQKHDTDNAYHVFPPEGNQRPRPPYQQPQPGDSSSSTVALNSNTNAKNIQTLHNESSGVFRV